MFWILLILFFSIIGAKYYTAIGTRKLERRLNRVKVALEDARQDLQGGRQLQADIAEQEKLSEQHVRYMKELIHDIQVRLTEVEETQEGQRSLNQPDPRNEITASVIRF